MLEFHNKYIRLNEQYRLAIRYNHIDADGRIHSPIITMPILFWPKDAFSVNETEPEENQDNPSQSRGIYGVPIEKAHKYNLACEAIRNAKDGELAIYLLGYYPSDIIVAYKNEIAMRQCNIIGFFRREDYCRIAIRPFLIKHLMELRESPTNTYAALVKRPSRKY